ncbi:MAG: hypothetical protein GX224_06995 [Thermoplasmatales archaeon]|nr:hypothetical protein [Thermoplasmatales archaeon]
MSNYGPVIGLLGGMLAIFGLFLAWISIETTFLFFTTTFEATGWEIFQDYNDGFDYYYIPLIVMVLGIVACLVAIVSVSGGKGVGAINALLGLAILALPIAFYYMSFVSGNDVTFGEAMESVKFGAGMWMCVIGGFLTSVGGLAAKGD